MVFSHSSMALICNLLQWVYWLGLSCFAYIKGGEGVGGCIVDGSKETAPGARSCLLSQGFSKFLRHWPSVAFLRGKNSLHKLVVMV